MPEVGQHRSSDYSFVKIEARSTAPWTLPSHVSMRPAGGLTGLRGAARAARRDPSDARRIPGRQRLRHRGLRRQSHLLRRPRRASAGIRALRRSRPLAPRHPLHLGRRPQDPLAGPLEHSATAWVGTSGPSSARDAARMNRDSSPGSTNRWIIRSSPSSINFDAHNPYILPAGFDRHFGVAPRSSAGRHGPRPAGSSATNTRSQPGTSRTVVVRARAGRDPKWRSKSGGRMYGLWASK